MTLDEFVNVYAAPIKRQTAAAEEDLWVIFKDRVTARQYLEVLGLTCPTRNEREAFNSKLRVAALRRQMSSHPDKGGNTERFLEARKIVKFFQKEGFF